MARAHGPGSRLLLTALLGAGLGACVGSVETAEPLPPPPSVLPGAKGAAVEIVTSRELEEVARLEDARSLGDGRLLALLSDSTDPRTRARAATALGRFPFPRFGTDVTAALARALEDPDRAVRLEAAFALGLRGDPESLRTLLAYRNDADALLRARVVEAAGRLATPQMQPQVALALRDADLAVRIEAAEATAGWDPDAAGADEIDRALLDALSPYRITSELKREAAPKSAVEAELVWRILWALGRRKAELGRGPFLEYARSDVPLERLFALRGLAQLAPDAESVRAAAAALVGPAATRDWRVAYEATAALGRFAAAELSPALEDIARAGVQAAAERPSAHVRAAAMDAVGSLGDGQATLAILQRGRLDLSVSVRAAALKARVRIAGPDDAMDALQRATRDDDPVIRGAAAEAAGTWPEPQAVDVLLALARDPALYVGIRAVEELGRHPGPRVRAELHRFLENTDNGIRLAAVNALQRMPDPADVQPLTRAYSSSTGEGAPEVAFNALRALDAIGTPEARAVVAAAESDSRPFVRSVAKDLGRAAGGAPRAEEPAEPPSDRGVPLAGKDYPLYRFNPMVELNTSRGSMVFELFPGETPVHVHNFLELVRRGHYDGLTFHRVVPDFVVQGGDHRGDGNGGIPWEGEALRAEFTPRKYTRGSLGMPRNEDPDSGGSQFFVTHVPTPHLDGRYTVFGELRTGGDVLDQLEVGDRILSARVLE